MTSEDRVLRAALDILRDRRFYVREGKVRGKGRYLRISGCTCDACVEWVDDVGDATGFISKRPWPRKLSRRDGGRIVSRPSSPRQSDGTEKA